MAAHQTMLDIIGVIDRGSCQVALIVDEHGVLQGIVSDGDVRRAILRGEDLQTPVARIMNSKPLSVRLGEGPGAALILMRDNMLRYIPVLDADGRLIDVWSIEHLLHFNALPNSVVIMAGGLGSRLAPLTEDIPKPMLPVGGRPLLEHIIQHFINTGFRRFYLSVNYKAQYIIDHFQGGTAFGASINYLREDKRLGTAGALSLLPELPTTPTIIINGDILTRMDFSALLHAHNQTGVAATMVVKEHAIQIPYGVVSVNEQGLMTGIEEKPHHLFSISAGINVLSPEAFAHIPKDTFFDMPDLFSALIAAGSLPAVYKTEDYWLDIGRLADYRKANEEFSLLSSTPWASANQGPA